MRVARILRVPTIPLKGHSASGQGGSAWSSPLRLDGSRDDQAGEAGPVEQQLSRGQESQNFFNTTVSFILQLQCILQMYMIVLI